jgi:hypothetical protein
VEEGIFVRRVVKEAEDIGTTVAWPDIYCTGSFEVFFSWLRLANLLIRLLKLSLLRTS